MNSTLDWGHGIGNGEKPRDLKDRRIWCCGKRSRGERLCGTRTVEEMQVNWFPVSYHLLAPVFWEVQLLYSRVMGVSCVPLISLSFCLSYCVCVCVCVCAPPPHSLKQTLKYQAKVRTIRERMTPPFWLQGRSGQDKKHKLTSAVSSSNDSFSIQSTYYSQKILTPANIQIINKYILNLI